MRNLGSQGFILPFVLVVMIMLSGAALYVLSAAANQKVMTNQIAQSHMTSFYNAQAGIVDASWRIRNNYVNALMPDTTNPDPSQRSTGTSFDGSINPLNNGFNPLPYYLDLSVTPPAPANPSGFYATEPTPWSCKVDIGPVNAATGVRSIEVTGNDAA